jgi:hypothetical protein
MSVVRSVISLGKITLSEHFHDYTQASVAKCGLA